MRPFFSHVFSYGVWRGERLCGMQLVGLVLALGGLFGLLFPGFSAPPLAGALLRLGAGVAWGVYSLLQSLPRSAASRFSASR